MAAIRHEPAMADAGLGRHTRDFADSTYERKNSCKFPVVYREPRFALSEVVLPNPAPDRPERATLNAPTADDCGRRLLAGVFARLRDRFDIFRKRSQLPQTKPTGKTVVKITFEHEQHRGWPNEPDGARRRRAFWPNEPERVQCSEKSYRERRNASSTRSRR